MSHRFLQGPKWKYRSNSSIHSHSKNFKNIQHGQQRLIPLTSELIADNISSYCLTDKEFLEPLSNIIKSEVLHCISELKENFTTQSDFHQLRQLVTNYAFTNSSLPATSNNSSECGALETESSQPIYGYGDSRILDGNQFYPLDSIYSNNTKGNLIASFKSIIPTSCEILTGEVTLKKIKDLETRMKNIEAKLDYIQTCMKEIQLTNLHNIETLRCEQATKINAINQEITDLQLDLNTCLNDDQGFESKLQDIEEKVKQSLYETQHNINKSVNSEEWDKNTNYDDMFYELRQMQMNELYYKKTKRNLYLNHRPQMNPFGSPPPPSITSKEEKICAPRFVESHVE